MRRLPRLATALLLCKVHAFLPRRARSPGTGRAHLQAMPSEGESWFVKTETFCKPFPQVKPHLEAHREWVAKLRANGHVITSGYRVDAEGKPGGGGMMFFAARDYDAAHALVQQDPLIANQCVDWRLNGWIAEVGDVEVR